MIIIIIIIIVIIMNIWRLGKLFLCFEHAKHTVVKSKNKCDGRVRRARQVPHRSDS